MRKRTMLLGLVCVMLNGIAIWSAFRGPDWLTFTLVALIALTVLGIVASLLLHRGDWRFRGVALFAVGGYLLFNGYQMWEFFTHVD